MGPVAIAFRHRDSVGRPCPMSRPSSLNISRHKSFTVWV